MKEKLEILFTVLNEAQSQKVADALLEIANHGESQTTFDPLTNALIDRLLKL